MKKSDKELFGMSDEFMDLAIELIVKYDTYPTSEVLKKSQSSIGRLFIDSEVLRLLDRYVALREEE